MVADGSKVAKLSLFSRLNKVLFSYTVCCTLLTIFVALCRTSFQYVYVCLVLGGTKRDTALEMLSHECWIEEKDHFSQTSGYILADSAQDAIGPFFASRAHTAGCGSRCPPASSGLLCKVAFSPPDPTSVLLAWDSSTQDQDFTFFFTELHEIHISPPSSLLNYFGIVAVHIDNFPPNWCCLQSYWAYSVPLSRLFYTFKCLHA